MTYVCLSRRLSGDAISPLEGEDKRLHGSGQLSGGRSCCSDRFTKNEKETSICAVKDTPCLRPNEACNGLHQQVPDEDVVPDIPSGGRYHP
ncbi:hypothetical protein EVAR_20146_1 [Eumeta japonica]|uniref:Uncharacterized protein n=1 Tax=Eumeta variegata TaxID=151549 RepID=A0A4C1V3P3_EUMVA|nr:hypothetical protein EVAR_20146_1 [Eumeta japonica]